MRQGFKSVACLSAAIAGLSLRNNFQSKSQTSRNQPKNQTPLNYCIIALPQGAINYYPIPRQH